MSFARSCYDHIAGRLGTELHEVFIDRHWVDLHDGIPALTPTGESFVVDFGIDLDELMTKRRPLLRIDLALPFTDRMTHSPLGEIFA